ncbi:hypothetical protein CDD83_5674 [Cordyceps sp. RAO-2017]|nr:hypothetical protein CDD83_5674 [Cordyceps sp. RAO-2017]
MEDLSQAVDTWQLESQTQQQDLIRVIDEGKESLLQSSDEQKNGTTSATESMKRNEPAGILRWTAEESDICSRRRIGEPAANHPCT